MTSASHIDKRNYDIRAIDHEEALACVVSWHYAKGGSKTGTDYFGLFRRDGDRCLGAAWFLPPTKCAAKFAFPAHDWRKIVALHRLAVDPIMPTNAASFLIGRALRALKREKRWQGVVTFADTRRGHSGTIYKATNWTYRGETQAKECWVDINGRQVSKQSTRTRTSEEMRRLGYTMIGRFKKHRFTYQLQEPQ